MKKIGLIVCAILAVYGAVCTAFITHELLTGNMKAFSDGKLFSYTTNCVIVQSPALVSAEQ